MPVDGDGPPPIKHDGPTLTDEEYIDDLESSREYLQEYFDKAKAQIEALRILLSKALQLKGTATAPEWRKEVVKALKTCACGAALVTEPPEGIRPGRYMFLCPTCDNSYEWVRT